MQRFESTTPEGVDLVLWGDLRTMFDANTEDELWQNQERWKPNILMNLEAMMEVRRTFKCWFYHDTTNGHQFTMSNRHQELASLEQTTSALAIPEQTATSKETSNPFMAGSLPKTARPT
ncbi:hypothetical protein Tco_0540578 [Tanacetum coccineum]